MVDDLEYQEDINQLARSFTRMVLLLRSTGKLSDEGVEFILKGGANMNKLQGEMSQEEREEFISGLHSEDGLPTETVDEWLDELDALDAVTD